MIIIRKILLPSVIVISNVNFLYFVFYLETNAS